MATAPLRILDGIRIVSFTQFLLGPAAVQYLNDMGADVIKVEPPQGAWERGWSGGNNFVGGVSTFYMLAHRNVRAITLNLRHSRAQEVASKLVAESDVLVENYRPGVMERFGIGYEQARAINPRLIYASASGYGSDSPFRDLPGQDLLIQAVSGLAASTGRAGQPPVPAGAAVVDQHAAALLAMAILGGLYHRERTGEGQHVEVVMLQAAFDLQTEPLVYYLNGGDVRLPKHPLASAFHQAPYGVYQTADGYVVLSVTPMKIVAAALGDPPELRPYADDPAIAFQKKDDIYAALAPILRQKTTAEWLDTLQSRGVWCAPVNDYTHLFEDPIVQAANPVLEVEHPRVGTVHLIKHPVRYSSGEAVVRRAPPELSEHTDEVLCQLGYGADEIERLREQGVV